MKKQLSKDIANQKKSVYRMSNEELNNEMDRLNKMKTTLELRRSVEKLSSKKLSDVKQDDKQKGLLNLILNEGPFYLTSCNISNQETIRTIQEAKKIFPNLIYFDFGPGSNKASQIIDTKTGKVIRD